MEIKPRRTGIEATNNGKWMRQWGTGTARRGTFLWKSLMDIKGAVNSIPSTALTNPRIAVADNGKSANVNGVRIPFNGARKGNGFL
jgi:hypothetical protein